MNVVVDLDGTLYKGNTFHAFIFFIFKQAFKQIDVFWLVSIVFWTKLRIIKLISHKKWKYQILKSCNNKKIHIDCFVASLQKKMQPFILNEIKHYETRILATAAPEIYALAVSKKYQFTHCSATMNANFFEDFSENCKGNKFNNVQKILQQTNSSTINLMITDHLDDALLIKSAEKSWLINANEKLKKFIYDNNLTNCVTYINGSK